MTKIAAAALTAMAFWCCQALADSAKVPPILQGPRVSVQGYGRQNPECATWTDGCVLCIGDDDGRGQCSTPGIACTPHGVTCKVLRHDH